MGLSVATESHRLRQCDHGHSACGYLPCSLEKGLGSLHAACPTKAAGRWTPCWVWYIDFNPIFKHSSLIPFSERAQLWKSRPADVKGSWEWVCHRLSCSSRLLHCGSCFLLLLSFTLFSREREHFCELKLHPIHFMGLWITGQAAAWGSFSSTVSCCGSCLTGGFPVFQAHVPSILISFL